jgi:hypothetical protein
MGSRRPPTNPVNRGEAKETFVNTMKAMLGSMRGDPVFMRRLNGWLTVFWVAMIPISYELGWLKSVVFVSALSLWALVSGHWSTWQAARVEVTQQREAEELRAHPVETRVVDALLAHTDVERAAE